MGRLLVLTIASLMLIQIGFACSGYKITTGRMMILGRNEDAWGVTLHIWFENAASNGQNVAAFTGSRYDGENGYAQQSGIYDIYPGH